MGIILSVLSCLNPRRMEKSPWAAARPKWPGVACARRGKVIGSSRLGKAARRVKKKENNPGPDLFIKYFSIFASRFQIQNDFELKTNLNFT
jgi:hypothetical protein